MISGRQRARGAQNGRYGGVGGYAGILHAKTNMAKTYSTYIQVHSFNPKIQ